MKCRYSCSLLVTSSMLVVLSFAMLSPAAHSAIEPVPIFLQLRNIIVSAPVWYSALAQSGGNQTALANILLKSPHNTFSETKLTGDQGGISTIETETDVEYSADPSGQLTGAVTIGQKVTLQPVVFSNQVIAVDVTLRDTQIIGGPQTIGGPPLTAPYYFTTKNFVPTVNG